LSSLPEMAIARQREPEVVRAGLAAWLRQPVSELSQPAAGGLSSETYLFASATGEQLVARLAPAGDALFPVYDLEMQGRIMQVLGANDVVPVPRVVEYVADTEFLGSPFLVMERVAGRIPSDNPPFVLSGWVHDAPAESQRVLQDEFVSVCANIHSADWRGLGLGEIASRSGGTTLAAEVSWWSDYLDWAADGSPPVALRDARAWCAENVPVDEPEPALCWGDVRIPNVVFDDDFRPRAVLDWEMATIGPPEVDIGWFLVIHGLTTAVTGDLPGFRARDEVLRAYESQLGRALHDLTWYETWAAFRAAAIMVRLARLLHDLGLVADLRMQEHNPPIELLQNRLK
jgi:aminoglycoside phosphotransferase (APT) family kinase protein